MGPAGNTIQTILQILPDEPQGGSGPSGDDGLWHDTAYFVSDDGLWHDTAYFIGDDGQWHDTAYF